MLISPDAPLADCIVTRPINRTEGTNGFCIKRAIVSMRSFVMAAVYSSTRIFFWLLFTFFSSFFVSYSPCSPRFSLSYPPPFPSTSHPAVVQANRIVRCPINRADGTNGFCISQAIASVVVMLCDLVIVSMWWLVVVMLCDLVIMSMWWHVYCHVVWSSEHVHVVTSCDVVWSSNLVLVVIDLIVMFCDLEIKSTWRGVVMLCDLVIVSMWWLVLMLCDLVNVHVVTCCCDVMWSSDRALSWWFDWCDVVWSSDHAHVVTCVI